MTSNRRSIRCRCGAIKRPAAATCEACARNLSQSRTARPPREGTEALERQRGGSSHTRERPPAVLEPRPRTLYDVLRNWLWLVAIGWSFWMRVLGPKRGPKILLGGMALSAVAITLYEATS